jgi:GT2 family glycosyltransferase
MNRKIFNELEILTITYKSNEIIERTLSKINKKFKITIVENSADKKFQKEIQNFKNRNCILTGSNLGFGAAFNIGARKIKSKYILHINPDAFINNKIIYELYKIAKKIKNLGILSPIETSKQTRIKKKSDKEYYEVENVKGFVMMINNFNCKKTKYFDDNFFLYLEEIDLCIRLKKMKKLICLAPHIFVKHLGGKSHSNKFSQKMEMQRNWHYVWSLFYFTKKHHGSIQAYKLTLIKFLSAFVKSLFYFFINQKKYTKYKYRFLGLLNSYIGNDSKFRG